MAVSSEARPRRGRYTRQPRTRWSALTPRKLALLAAVAELGIASLPQLAVLTCPSAQSARRHLRVLFDEGLVEVVPVPRVALADPARAGDADLLYGSAPNLYTLTRAGRQVLEEVGLGSEFAVPARYGPKNGLFLAHELMVRDVRVWLQLVARGAPGQRLERWVDGAGAVIELDRPRPPRQVRPDAWFVYRAGEAVLVGLVEVDRGTERGRRRWDEKVASYGALFAGGRLREVTGYGKARVLVITPDVPRRERLREFVTRKAPPELASRFWLADRGVLATPDLGHAGWQRAGSQLLRPLIPPGGGPEQGGNSAGRLWDR